MSHYIAAVVVPKEEQTAEEEIVKYIHKKNGTIFRGIRSKAIY